MWVDTCCVDKKSSAELSEAINSMYRWYYNAQVCYAFLEDVSTPREDRCNVHDRSTFARMNSRIAVSRWFTRGWTLQELIAPRRVEFYDMAWNPLGVKEEVVWPLFKITGIPTFVLRDRNQLQRASIAQKMAWASGRVTSRLEDQAYCLLGLFDVNIPLLYGEGKKAFVRLQEEIIQSRSWEAQDQSILAFESADGDLLASSPQAFRGCHGVVRTEHAGDGILQLSKRGLRLNLLGRTLPAADEKSCESDRALNDLMIVLDCTRSGGDSRIALCLRARPPIDSAGRPGLDAGRGELVYYRLPELFDLRTSHPPGFHHVEVTIARKAFFWPRVSRNLVVNCPKATIHLDSACTARNCGFTKCPEQSWTNRSGHHLVVLPTVGERERGRIRMGLGSDGRFSTDFKVRFQEPKLSSNTAGREARELRKAASNSPRDILVHLEADGKTLPPMLVARCSNVTSHSAEILANEKPRLLRVGSSHMFKLDTDDCLQVTTGIGFENGESVWRLNLALVKPETHCPADNGPQDASSTLVAEQQLLPLPDHRCSWSLKPSVRGDMFHITEIQTLQQELSNMRDDLWSCYQKSLCEIENLAQRLENTQSSRCESQGIPSKCKSAPLAVTDATGEGEVFDLEALLLPPGSASVDAVAERNVAENGAEPGTPLMQAFYEPEAEILTVCTNPAEAAAAYQVEIKPLNWETRSFHRPETKVIADVLAAEAAVLEQSADRGKEGSLPSNDGAAEDNAIVASLMEQLSVMICENPATKLRRWHAVASSPDRSKQLTHGLADSRTQSAPKQPVPSPDAMSCAMKSREGPSRMKMMSRRRK